MISAINSTTKFKGIYIVDEAKMSSNQKNIATEIKNVLKKDSKSKDFLLRSEPKTDSVTLSQVFGLKASKNSLHKGDYIYTNFLKIGTYNEADEFNLSDLDGAYRRKEQQKKDNIFVAIGLLLLTGYLSLATVHYVKRVLPVAKSMNKNNVEMVSDSLKNNFVKRLK